MWENHKNVFPKSQHVERCTIDKWFQFRFRILFRINFIQNGTIKTQLLKGKAIKLESFFSFLKLSDLFKKNL